MATQIKLPHLGEKIESGDVLSILVAAGDTITVDQDLIEVETDKATMPIPSPQAGKVTKLLVSEGDTIEVGAPILEIEAEEGATNGKSPTKSAPAADKTPAKKQAPVEPKSEVSEADIPPAPDTDVPTVVEPEPEPKAAAPKPAPD